MGNKDPPPDERVVYLALKNVFKGPDAVVRQPRAILKLIRGSQSQGCVESLVREHNIDKVCNVARTLLTEEVFGSTLKAKIRFPEVFDVSPAQSAEREASEEDAARDEASTIKNVAQGYQEDIEAVAPARLAVESEGIKPFRRPNPFAGKGSRNIPSLFPVYLPLKTQHHILVKVQTILEHACFDFGQQNMPDVLEKRGWDCAESAELNLWAAEFLNHRSSFGDRESDVGRPFEKLFRSVADIRHSAVHRIRVSAKGVEQFILDAESLATLLNDGARLESLKRMRRDTQLAIEELERNKHVLGSQLTETRKKIAAQRAELDRLEDAAVADMMREDGEYQRFAGANLERAIVSFEATTLAADETENEAGSDVGDTDNTETYDESGSSRCRSNNEAAPEGIRINGLQEG